MQLLRVLSRSQVEAQYLKQNSIGTEHLLLAIIQESKGVTTAVLDNLEINTSEVRETIEGIIDSGDRFFSEEIPFTPRAKKVIELAKDEAQSMKHHYLGIEHLLLGIVREGEGIAVGVLERRGATMEKVRTEIIKVFDKL